jgi:hypothetical protein
MSHQCMTCCCTSTRRPKSQRKYKCARQLVMLRESASGGSSSRLSPSTLLIWQNGARRCNVAGGARMTLAKLEGEVIQPKELLETPQGNVDKSRRDVRPRASQDLEILPYAETRGM